MIGTDAVDCLNNLCDRFVTNDPLRTACSLVLDDPAFETSFGSAGEHHCYAGGLAAHTLEVVRYCIDMSEMMQVADKSALITAAVFHDYMKIKEYKSSVETFSLEKTPYRKLVRHVAGSHAAFVSFIDTYNDCNPDPVSEELVILVEHCILAHHGRFEWGSPVLPQTVEAHILHFADQFSALYGPTKNAN